MKNGKLIKKWIAGVKVQLPVNLNQLFELYITKKGVPVIITVNSGGRTCNNNLTGLIPTINPTNYNQTIANNQNIRFFLSYINTWGHVDRAIGNRIITSKNRRELIGKIKKMDALLDDKTIEFV